MSQKIADGGKPHVRSLLLKLPMNWSPDDYQNMALALQLAEKGAYTARPNPMVGCVIVNQGKIVGQGWHQKFGEAHAEINALKPAGEQAKDATCYVTLEPCSHTGKTGPCAQALIDAGVAKVIAAIQDPNPKVSGKGFELLNQAGIETQVGLLQPQAEVLNKGFVSQFVRKRPWVSVKLAMSLDGRTALADGSSQWITGASARLDVQRLRARQDAIVTGIGTLLSDNPSMTVRGDGQSAWFGGLNDFSQPMRILLDRQARADLSCKLFKPHPQDRNPVWWVTEQTQPLESQNLVNVKNVPSKPLAGLLKELSENGVNQLLVESGHRLAGAFLSENLVDEIIVYMAAKLMGDKAMGLFELNIAKMSESRELSLTDVRQFGDDIRFIYRPKS